MTEEQLIKKANDVYKFSKRGTFHKVFAGIECKYKYTLPDKYVVFTNKNLSDGLYAVIAITPDEGMRDDDMKILFEPMNDDAADSINIELFVTPRICNPHCPLSEGTVCIQLHL